MCRMIPGIATLLLCFGLLASRSPAVMAGGGCHEPVTESSRTTVDLKSGCFIDTVIRLPAGATVTWTNRDDIEHSVSGVGIRSGDGWGSFEPLAQDQTVSHQFGHDGIYLYFCAFHPSMVGAVVVGDGQSEPIAARPVVALDVAGSDGRANEPASQPTADNSGLVTVAFVVGAVALVAAIVGWSQLRRERL